MEFSQTGFVGMSLFIFLMVSPLSVVEGRTRLLHNLHDESGSGMHVIPSDEQPFSGHSPTYPGYNSVRKLFARRFAIEATEAGKSASSKNDVEGQASVDSEPAAASSISRRRLPFHTQFVSKFSFFSFAKDSGTVTPSPGTPSPGHN